MGNGLRDFTDSELDALLVLLREEGLPLPWELTGFPASFRDEFLRDVVSETIEEIHRRRKRNEDKRRYTESYPARRDELLKIELEKMRIEAGVALSDEFVEPAPHLLKFDTYHDETLRQLIYEVRGYIWQRQIDRTVIEYPRDWWQAFRERFAPEWAKRRWPIVWKREIVESRELFTNLAVPENAGYKTALHVTHESELTTREE